MIVVFVVSSPVLVTMAVLVMMVTVRVFCLCVHDFGVGLALQVHIYACTLGWGYNRELAVLNEAKGVGGAEGQAEVFVAANRGMKHERGRL